MGCAPDGEAALDEPWEALQQAISENQLPNSSFESGAADWNCFQCNLSSIAHPYAPSGARVGLAKQATGSDFSVGDWPGTLSTVAGRRFEARASFRGGGNSLGETGALCLRERNSGGSFVGTQCSSNITFTNVFQTVTVQYTAVGSNKLDLYLFMREASGEALLVDSVFLGVL